MESSQNPQGGLHRTSPCGTFARPAQRHGGREVGCTCPGGRLGQPAWASLVTPTLQLLPPEGLYSEGFGNRGNKLLPRAQELVNVSPCFRIPIERERLR